MDNMWIAHWSDQHQPYQDNAIRPSTTASLWIIVVHDRSVLTRQLTFTDRDECLRCLHLHYRGGYIITETRLIARPSTPSPLLYPPPPEEAMYHTETIEEHIRLERRGPPPHHVPAVDINRFEANAHDIEEMLGTVTEANTHYGNNPADGATQGGHDWQEYWRRSMGFVEEVQKGTPDPKGAYDRAVELLNSCLTESELEELHSFDTITLDTEIGKFRIDTRNREPNWNGMPIYNVWYKKHRYCLVIGNAYYLSYVPIPDHFLMQVLLIRADPNAFLKMANSDESTVTI